MYILYTVKVYQAAILPRAASNCFILDIEHITLTCTAEKCWILHPEQPLPSSTAPPPPSTVKAHKVAVDQFVVDLAKNVQSYDNHYNLNGIIAGSFLDVIQEEVHSSH